MLYNIKVVYLHCVFHGIRFKVNEDWVSGKIPFFFVYVSHHFSFARTKEKRSKKKIRRLCFFFLLQYFSSLNKKNSLCSNSFLFLTLQKELPLNGKKMRTDLDVLWGGGMKHRFARWSNLSSYNIEVFTSTSEAMLDPNGTGSW